MDDYSISSLQESRNEWSSRLLNILTPLVVQGFQSIFVDAVKLCTDNNEDEKYLMTFQNFITRVPNWNSEMIEKETERIVETSHCSYLEDLISCVHIIHLKSLTCMRVGSKQKKIEINVPNLKDFIHKVYINSARTLYSNVYLYEQNIESLQIQKHNREKEVIIKECILDTLRANIPVEELLRSYLDESVEELVEQEEKEEIISREPIIEEKSNEEKEKEKEQEKVSTPTPSPTNISHNSTENKSLPPINFNNEVATSESTNISFAPLPDPVKEHIEVPILDDDEDDDLIKIGGDVKLETLDVHSLEDNIKINTNDLLKDEIEILT